MYRPYNRLLTCTAYYSTWYHAACAAHKDQQPRRTHVLDLVQNRLRARPRTYVAASSLCARPRSSNNSLCARPRSCKLFVRPTSMHRPACTQMVGSRSRLRASDRSSKLLARASKSFGQPTVHTRPIRTPQTAPTASNPIRSELCFKGGLASFDRLDKRFAGAAALNGQAAAAANRLCSRSKLAKVERPRFWGYSEVYCVAVAPRAARGARAACDRYDACHTSRKSKSIRVPGGSDPTACFAAPRTSTGTPGGDGASHPAPEG